MENQELANGLVTLEGNELRHIYVLLLRTNIGHMLSAKSKDLLGNLSKEKHDNFAKHLEEKVKELEHEKDEVLQVELFMEFTKILNVPITKYSLQKEIEDQCVAIVLKTHQYLWDKEEAFKSFSENLSNNSEIFQILQYEMQKLFKVYGDNYKNLPESTKKKIDGEVEEYIKTLSLEEQAEINEKLGVDELNDQVLRDIMATSGISFLFGTIVQVSGFAFYTTATSLLASLAGAVGVTLPFTVYTGMTSILAVFANPLFIFPLLLGGGGLYINHQNKNMKERLMPIIVVILAAKYTVKDDGKSFEYDEVKFNLFISEWEKRYNTYQTLHREKNKSLETEENLKTILQFLNSQSAEIDIQESRVEKKLATLRQKIIEDLEVSMIHELYISPSITKKMKEYDGIINNIESLALQQHSTNKSWSFFNKVTKKWTRYKLLQRIEEEEKKADELFDSMLDEIFTLNNLYEIKEGVQLREGRRQLQELTQKRFNIENKRQTTESKIKALKQEIKSYNRQIEVMENKNYGFDNLKIVF